MATLAELEDRIESLEATRAAQTPIIQRHQLALEQIKTKYNAQLVDIKDTFDLVDGLNDDDAQLNAIFDPNTLTYTI